MSHLLHELDADLAAVVEKARRSLVQISDRGQQGAGAGTIWHPDGLVITNAHVVTGRSPQVTLPDGRVLPARLLAAEPALDVAALTVEARDLPPIELGESTKLRAGEWVVALGHPWGVLGAATAGVVIGVGADWPELPQRSQAWAAPRGRPAPRPGDNAELSRTADWVVASLHLRPGHSGGPLVDVHGRLVGINTIMAGPGVGVAVPVHAVKVFLRTALGR